MNFILPAGLINDEIEIFTDPNNREFAYFQTGGRADLLQNAPSAVLQVIRMDMAARPEKMDMLRQLGYHEISAQLNKYACCVSGSYDRNPDIVNGKLVHSEFWPCPERLTCIGADILCNPLQLKNGTLTKRQTEVLRLTGLGLLRKEIADRLHISEETVKRHVNEILKRAGLMNGKELVALAYQKNLIS